jgi:hypothetical protein
MFPFSFPPGLSDFPFSACACPVKTPVQANEEHRLLEQN